VVERLLEHLVPLRDRAWLVIDDLHEQAQLAARVECTSGARPERS
jgi:hypothetical protein